jgi:hypothetical protein
MDKTWVCVNTELQQGLLLDVVTMGIMRRSSQAQQGLAQL